MHALENGGGFREIFLRDGAEQGGDADLVIYDDACGASADGIDPRHVGSGAMEGCGDIVVMVARAFPVFRIPRGFLGENGLAIDDGGNLEIAGSEIEADAAAFQMAASRDFHVFRGGNEIRVGD